MDNEATINIAIDEAVNELVEFLQDTWLNVDECNGELSVRMNDIQNLLDKSYRLS